MILPILKMHLDFFVRFSMKTLTLEAGNNLAQVVEQLEQGLGSDCSG